MATKIPKAIADLELSLASSISVGATSFTLSASTDDDGQAIPAGKYCFTIDSGTSNKEYLLGQVNGTAVTSVVSVSRQGVETSGAARAHRVGAPCILTDFATIQRVADVLNGDLALDGSSPIIYDAEPTLADRKELATVGYVLDTVSGGTVAFDAQTIAGTAGESIVAGDLVYFKTSDQEWYKTDADTAATVEGVQLGIALGSGTDGVAITGGIQIAGTYTTSGLTAGSLYYASNTAGAIASSAGTTSQIVGLALSTTKLLIIPRNPQSVTTREKDAMSGGSDFGTPSSSNKFATQDYISATQKIDVFTSNGTWTKPTNAKFVEVHLIGAGGGGGGGQIDTGSPFGQGGGGGAGGGYSRAVFRASNLSSTETITIGTAGTGGAGKASGSQGSGTAGTAGTDTSFGTKLVAKGGSGGSASTLTPATGGSGTVEDGGNGGAAGSNTTNPTSGSTTKLGAATGGGGGTSVTQNNGEAGGAKTLQTLAGGNAGVMTTSPNGGTGNQFSSNEAIGGTGGGGGAQSDGTAAAGNGGNGGFPGGGGGGGGTSTNTSFSAGSGGNGAAGIAVVISYL